MIEAFVFFIIVLLFYTEMISFIVTLLLIVIFVVVPLAALGSLSAGAAKAHPVLGGVVFVAGFMAWLWWMGPQWGDLFWSF